MQYRKDVEKVGSPNPRRILFYRDGISEGKGVAICSVASVLTWRLLGQFKECKEVEVAAIFR